MTVKVLARGVPRPGGPDMVRSRNRWITWAAPAAVMAMLGFWRVDQPALWGDELATWGAARLPWRDLWSLLANVDAVIAPYYTFMRVWVSIFGDGTLAMRFPSLLAMVGAAGLTAVLGARLRGPRTGLMAGMVLALTPASSRYAQEARPYAGTVLLATVATLLWSRALDSPRTTRFAAYAGSLAALSLTHPIAASLVLAHGVSSWRHELRWRWLAWASLGVLPAAGLLAFGATQRAQVSWIPTVTWSAAVGVPGRLAGAGVIGGALLTLGLAAARLDQATLPVIAWAAVPPGLLLAAGFVAPVWVHRYVLFTLPAWALLAAFTLARVQPGAAIATLVALTLLGLPAQRSLRGPAGHGQASSQIAGVIGPRFQPGDVAVYGDTHPSISWAPRDIVARYLPADRTPRDALALAPQRTGGRLRAARCADVAACLNGAPRVWVIRADGPADPRSGLAAPVSEVLSRRYHVAQVWRLPMLTIALLA